MQFFIKRHEKYRHQEILVWFCMFNVAKIKILHQVGNCEYLTLLVWSKVKKKILVCINSTLYNYFPFFRPRHKLANLGLGEFKTIFMALLIKKSIYYKLCLDEFKTGRNFGRAKNAMGQY